MAWLYATPKPAEGTRRAQEGAKVSKLNRLDRMRKDDVPVLMPPNPAPHIIDRLVEIGLTEAGAMSAVPLSWREIDAWSSRTGVDLAPWEARLIRSLSVAYVAESRRAESENAPPPWKAPITEREINTEEARLMAVLG